MKILFALILLMVTIVGLVEGTIFKKRIEKMKELAADFKENFYKRDTEEYKSEMVKLSIPLVLGAGFFFLIELLFYIMVVSISPLTLPTLVMMSLLIASIFVSIRKSTENTVKKTGLIGLDHINKEIAEAEKLSKVKTRTVYGMILKVISLFYFMYAILVLI